MPNYKNEKQNIIVNADMMAGYMNHAPTKTKQKRDRFLLAMAYLTGARPIELTRLLRKDIYILPENPQFLNIHLMTAKLKKVKRYIVRDRTLVLSIESAYVDEILQYIQPFQPEDRLLTIGTIRMRQIIWGASNNEICPYTLRHSRHARLAMLPDVGLAQLMSWKGSADTRSINPYLMNKPNIPRKID